MSKFDQFSENYDQLLNKAISASGESKEHFARRRVVFLSVLLNAMSEKPRLIMDFGCGTGSCTPFLFDILQIESLVGLDVSSASLEVAKMTYQSQNVQFLTTQQFQPGNDLDLAFCNGVFHHIIPNARLQALSVIYRSLRPGGLFAFWENNPWNLGTRYVMRHCAFDSDATTLTIPESRRMLRKASFEIVHTYSTFFFPRFLRCLRGIESRLSWLPLGAQYLIFCRKPDVHDKTASPHLL